MPRNGALDDAAVAAIYDALARAIDPKSDLEYGSPFELLVAVVLSAQATDKSVNLATRRLYPVANTPAAILALGVEGLTPYIRHIGLYRTKARNVIELCRLLIERHGGAVPGTRAELEALGSNPRDRGLPRVRASGRGDGGLLPPARLEVASCRGGGRRRSGRPPADHLPVDQPLPIGIFFSLALTSGGLGTVTVSTPLAKLAVALATSAFSGSGMDRWNFPYERSV